MSDILITKTNLEIATLEDERKKLEKKAQNANSQVIIAAVGFMIGLLLILLGIRDLLLCGIGVFLGIAGALALITQGLKKRKVQKERDQLDEQIKQKRQTIIASISEPRS